MKKINMIGLGAIALIATTSFGGVMPGLATLQSRGTAIAQTAQQQNPIQLKLAAERQKIVAVASGQGTWSPVTDNVRPGETIRYVVTASNTSDRSIKNLVVTQPVPNGSVYVLKSATLPDIAGAKLDYSIDGGKSYSQNPTIKVKLESGEIVNRPAPDSMYTNVRWNFGGSFPAKTASNATYQVRIRQYYLQ